jgi:hypothetical protein
MKKTKYAYVEKHFQEIKILKGQNISWREISEEMKERHRLSVSYTYLRKTWLDLEAKEPSPEKKAEIQEKVRVLLERQPMSADQVAKAENYKRLAIKRERLLQEAQRRIKELEEKLKKIVELLENGRRGMSKLLYRKMTAIADENSYRRNQ